MDMCTYTNVLLLKRNQKFGSFMMIKKNRKKGEMRNYLQDIYFLMKHTNNL